MLNLSGHFGELAALGTALSWALSATCFTSCGKRIGAFSTNHYRVLIATIFLGLMHFIFFTTFWPQANNYQLFFIILSGIIGIVIGDTCLFQSCIDVGPRIGLLIFNIYPLMTALLAWPILGENLRASSWIGLFIVLGGTLWVVKEKKTGNNINAEKNYQRGILLGILAAVCQSVGLIIVKPALTGPNSVDPLSVALLRLLSATIVIWSMSVLRGQVKVVIENLKDKKAMFLVFLGAFIGPFVGMWLLHVALKLIPAGIAAILMATTPIMILPIVVLVYKEKISWRSVLGAIIVVAGISILIMGK